MNSNKKVIGLSIRELRCPKCGASVSPDRNICDYCGAHYIVIEESKAILFGEYTKCTTFERLQFLKKEANEEWKEQWNKSIETRKFTVYDGYISEMIDLLKACKVCHIKNCPFFNKHYWEVVSKGGRDLTDEEYKKALDEAVKEALYKT